jgi:hypothetical protein
VAEASTGHYRIDEGSNSLTPVFFNNFRKKTSSSALIVADHPRFQRKKKGTKRPMLRNHYQTSYFPFLSMFG